MKSIPFFIKKISKEKFIYYIIPILSDMINDSNHHVRSILASSLMQICDNIDDDIFECYIFNMINKIIKDETFEVKNSAVGGLDKICKFLKNKNISEKLINPMITELAKDNKWRIRHTLCDKLNYIVDFLDVENFKTNFMNILGLFFIDHAAEIRKLVVKVFERILSKDFLIFLMRFYDFNTASQDFL